MAPLLEEAVGWGSGGAQLRVQVSGHFRSCRCIGWQTLVETMAVDRVRSRTGFEGPGYPE